MLITIQSPASRGVIADLPPHKLPLEAWSMVRNVAFLDGYIGQALRGESILTPGIVPLYVGSFQGEERLGAFAGEDEVYAFNASTAYEITRISGNYTGTEFDFWNGSMFNGFGILNNGVDVPQAWGPIDTSTPLVDLSNWPSTLRAKVIRPYLSFLVALDVTKSSTRDKRMVKWSHSADPNTLPSSWDETDATKDAGEVSLAEGKEGLLDCLDLGGINMLYTEAQTWAMRYVGGAAIFAFRKIFPMSGILAQDCACIFKSGHFVVTSDDIIVHDGSTLQSIADAATRNWFFNSLNSSNYKLTRVLPLYGRKEIWICFAQAGSALDTVLVWNWKYNTWSINELPNLKSVMSAFTLFDAPPDPWTLPDYTWTGEGSQTWGSITAGFHRTEAVVGVGTGQVLQYNGGTEGLMDSYLERTGIVHIAPDAVDEYTLKEILAVRPYLAGTGVQVLIEVGHQDTPEADVVWDDSATFTIGTDTEVAVNATGRYLAVRFSWSTAARVAFYGYVLDIVPLQEGL